MTPLRYGSGGGVSVSGCYVDTTNVGTCVSAGSAQNGVVYLDVLY